jgi:hypothetical protein
MKGFQFFILSSILLLISSLCCCGSISGLEENGEFISLSLEEWDQRFDLSDSSDDAVVDTHPGEDPQEVPDPTADAELAPDAPATADTLEEAADRVINALSVMDLPTVTAYAHPTAGLRFSPYTYVQDTHLVFMPDQLPQLAESQETLTWGYYDGTGDPIRMTYADYHHEFVYSADFVNAEAVAVNQELGQSSMINNIDAFYPGSSYVEYYFPGFDPDFGGMDWRSLRLVFVAEGDSWYLVGIVSDQWTI